MKLTFNRAGVERLIAHARAAAQTNQNFVEHHENRPAKPGLWLVGDQGVYLMSNGNPGLRVEGQAGAFVVYADEIDPTKLDFDVWYERKRRVFGGDDGVDVISLEDLDRVLVTYQPDQPLRINLTPRSMTLVAH